LVEPLSTHSQFQLGRPLKVLFVEDNPRDVNLLVRHLKKAGFDLQSNVATTLEEFTETIQSTSYDVILADYQLPGWSGLAALEALQETGKNVPFILVTGTVGEETAVECIKRGATDYILKDRLGRLSFAVQRALAETAAREERKKANKARDLLASIVESSDDAIIGIALDGTVLSWNRGAARIFGYSAQEIQEKPIALLFTSDGLDQLHKNLETLRSGESVSRYESRGMTKDRKPIEIAVTMSPIRSMAGSLEGASAIIRDISDQKQLEKEFYLSQKMEAIGQLAAGVAHDFNNLLTVVTGYSSLLLSDMQEHDHSYEEISEINKAGERAASLTRQLLAFSRKQVLQPRVVDLNWVVHEMDRMLRRVIGENINLTVMLDNSVAAIKADPGQIEQVIMNLALNARDAMRKGGQLTIRTDTVDLREPLTLRHLNIPPGAYVTLAVTDTGLGMSPEIQARIFEPFFTTKQQGEGTGLGLSTVYGIVKQSGGTIVVHSEPGQGTTFRIYLPRVNEIPARLSSPSVINYPPGWETILVVEDEDAVRALVCSILQKQGYNVLGASNAGEALHICEQHGNKIDLMITDVIMPSMSGSELADRLKLLRPEMNVLFISGYSDNAIAHQGILKPDTAFLEKPFEPHVLAAKVREILDLAAS
jgi:two-component system, cell cycle sensor histidine kinase and response regulator CckA